MCNSLNCKWSKTSLCLMILELQSDKLPLKQSGRKILSVFGLRLTAEENPGRSTSSAVQTEP